MNSALLNICAKAVPRSVREQHGRAITDLAQEMVADGASTPAKEALGIARYGMQKRFFGRKDWVTSLPWASALWILAAPLAAFQLAWLLFAMPIELVSPYLFANFGQWWAAILLAAVAAIIAAVRRDRVMLGLAMAVVIALELYEIRLTEFVSQGSDAGHATRLGWETTGMASSFYLGAIVALLPVSTVLIAAVFAPSNHHAGARRSVKYRLFCGFAPAAIAVGALVLRQIASLDGDLGAWWTNPVTQRSVIAIAATVALVIWLLRAQNDKLTHSLAAVIVLASQAPLAAWLLSAAPSALGFYDFGSSPAAMLLNITALLMLWSVPFLAVIAISRKRLGTPYPTPPPHQP